MSRNQKLLLTSTMAMAVSMAHAQPRGQRHFTQDSLMTFDQQTVDSSGIFLIGELERLDQTLNMPLVNIQWSRDIDLREDVTIGDELSSFTNSSFAAAGGPSPNGKNWIGKDANAIRGLALDIGKTAKPLTLWGMELGWTIPELESAQRAGRPVDAQKVEGMNLKYQMDIDEQVYLGDSLLGITGLLNEAGVDHANAVHGDWSNTATTPDQILADVNEILATSWANTGYAICPSDLLVPPLQFGVLVSRKVSDAGNISVLEYVRMNCLSMAQNGRPLNIRSSKWCVTAGASATTRMVAYTKDRSRVRFPLVPLQRTPLEYRSLNQLTTYFGRLGAVEWVYPETGLYRDGV